MMINDILVGGIATACLAVALFFFRFWRTTRDRFFLLFALSFLIEAANRLLVYLWVGPNEDAPVYYIVRLVAYGLIIAAIVDKNRVRRPSGLVQPQQR
ncbi:MAG: DUF5985 family protein [Betaproteobacteria bacterium]